MCDIEFTETGYIIHRAPPQEPFMEKVKRIFKRKKKKKKKS